MKRIACFILCIAMLLTLCACGSNNVPEATETNQQNTPNTNQPGVAEDIAPEDRPALPAEGEYTLSEYLATGDTIWYEFGSNKGKDSQVTGIYILTADGCIYWYEPYPAILLGELEQMEDADIIAMVKEKYPRHQFGYAMFVADDVYSKRAARAAIFQREVILHDVSEYYENPDNFTAQSLYESFYAEGGFMPTFAQNAAEENWDIIEQTYYKFWDCVVAHGPVSMLLIDSLFAASNTEEFEEDLAGYIRDGNVAADSADAFIEIFAKMNDVVEVVFADYNAQAEAYCETIEPADYVLTITTDSTGNNTLTMELVYAPVNNSYRRLTLGYEYPAGQNNSNCHTVVYDSLYGGYVVDGDDYLYTRVNGKLHFMLDAVGTYDIPIDVKDYESLFD